MMNKTEIENPHLGQTILKIFEDFVEASETTLLLNHLRALTKKINSNKYLLIILNTTMNIIGSREKIVNVDKEWLLQEILLPMFEKLKDPSMIKKYNNLLLKIFEEYKELRSLAISFSAEIFSKIFEVINVSSSKVKNSPMLSTAGVSLNILSNYTNEAAYKEFFDTDEENTLVFANILRIFWKLKTRIGVYYDTLVDTSLIAILNNLPREQYSVIKDSLVEEIKSDESSTNILDNESGQNGSAEFSFMIKCS